MNGQIGMGKFSSKGLTGHSSRMRNLKSSVKGTGTNGMSIGVTDDSGRAKHINNNVTIKNSRIDVGRSANTGVILDSAGKSKNKSIQNSVKIENSYVE